MPAAGSGFPPGKGQQDVAQDHEEATDGRDRSQPRRSPEADREERTGKDHRTGEQRGRTGFRSLHKRTCEQPWNHSEEILHRCLPVLRMTCFRELPRQAMSTQRARDHSHCSQHRSASQPFHGAELIADWMRQLKPCIICA